MDKSDIRKKLLKLRNDLLQTEQTGNEAAETVELDQSRLGRLSRMDALQAQALSVESKRRRVIRIQQIDSALQRNDGGTYGFCLHCEYEIAPKRLEVDPAALLCINCADRSEKQHT